MAEQRMETVAAPDPRDIYKSAVELARRFAIGDQKGAEALIRCHNPAEIVPLLAATASSAGGFAIVAAESLGWDVDAYLREVKRRGEPIADDPDDDAASD